MRRPAAVPRVASAPVMARTAGAFFVAGGLTSAAVTATGQHPLEPRALGLWAISAVALLVGALMALHGRRLPAWVFHANVVVATAMVTSAVALCPTFAGAVVLASVYLLVAVDAVVFFAWPWAVTYVLAVLAVEALTLLRHPAGRSAAQAGSHAGAAVGLVVVGLAVSAVVGLLVQRASGASRDSLTGLANRRGFDDALTAALSAAAASGQVLSVVLVDVDHFKAVNDTHGHAAGDELLCLLAAQWAPALAPPALLARRGGDEFAVLLPGVGAAAGSAVVQALRSATSGVAGARGATFSAGVAEHVAGEGGGDLLRRADAALYAAKAAGRDRTVLADAEAAHLAHDLARALADGQVHVHLQPIVALPSGALAGVEALARWDHPRRGAVRPDVFVPAAEAAGLITELGAAVLDQACRAAVALRAVHGEDLLLTVNASGRELTEPGYAARVAETLHRTGWRPAWLVVEVTESLLEASTPAALHALAALRELGVAVAIDDFGTGYSAFARLDTLPADYLKLDSTFVATTTTSPRRAAMLRAVLDLARALGLRVIAEGVEDAGQAALLTQLGCPLAQGHHYGRPQRPEDLAAALGARRSVPSS